MHRILDRQIKRIFGENATISSEWVSFLELISDTYTHSDEDRELLNRSLDLSSKEFLENNHRLEEARKKVEDQAENLARQVDERTFELKERISELEDVRRAMTNLLEDLGEKQEALVRANTKEEALVRDLEKYKLAVDNTSDGVIITDPEGVVIYGNTAVEKSTGYTIEEAIGKKAGALWRSPMNTEYYATFWNTIKTQKKTFTGEIQNKRKNGQLYTAMISISPILNKKGDILHFVGIERDITHEKEIDRAKTEFVSIASHALRTPLTAIDGLASMLLDGEYGQISTEVRQPIADITTSSERLIHLVNDLLNLSRIQAGKMKYTCTDFLISNTISETVRLLLPISKQKGLDLLVGTLDDSTVYGDLDKVKEVLNNLIGNSLKFTYKGTIIISTLQKNEVIEVKIVDTGIGIAQKDYDKLFGQFQQIESIQGKVIGTGLGLHISREMIRKMGGDLWLESSVEGAGSTFVFSIPLSKSVIPRKVQAEFKKTAESISNKVTSIRV